MPVYGVHKWALPPETIPLAQAVTSGDQDEVELAVGAGREAWGEDAVYRWFARCLLEGFVIDSEVLERDGTNLKEPAAVMTSSRPSARASALLLALKKQRVSTRSALIQALTESKRRYEGLSSSVGDAESHYLYLRDEISEFLKASARKRWRATYKRMLTTL